jgi:hypothetical protein
MPVFQQWQAGFCGLDTLNHIYGTQKHPLQEGSVKYTYSPNVLNIRVESVYEYTIADRRRIDFPNCS